MKVEFCSFCRTRQSPLFGVTSDPDAFCICGPCLNKYSEIAPKRLTESCCFCAETGKEGYMEEESGALICTECLKKHLEQSKIQPVVEQAPEEPAEINIQWPLYLDSSMDLIEVQITLRDGSTLSANFTTPGRVPWEMEKGKRNGQWAAGTYFWHPDLIFTEELLEDNIRKAVQDLSKSGLLTKAFKPKN